jgi:ankyrin repeat protein
MRSTIHCVTVLPGALAVLVSTACSAEPQDQPRASQCEVPEIQLDSNTTQRDANEALSLVQKFMTLWEQGKHKKASKLVFEFDPKRQQTRENVLAYIASRTAKLDQIHLFTAKKSGTRKQDIWRASAHFTVEPFDEMRMDLININGKWWIEQGFECVSLLDRAVVASNADEVRRLIDGGAEINRPEQLKTWGPDVQSKMHIGGYTPLTRACSCGIHAMTELLVNFGADVDQADGGRRFPILCALLMNDVKSLQVLIDAGCNMSPDGQHVLMHSFPYNKFSRATEAFLLDNGAGTNLPSHALFFACRKERDTTVRWILENGGDVDANYGQSGSSHLERSYLPIHAAVYTGNTNIVGILLQHGANINDSAGAFFTPLMCAAESRDPAMLKFLLAQGANIGFTNDKGWNALHNAAFKSSLPAIKVLHAASPKLLHSRTMEGETPLWFACIAHQKDLSAIRYLIEQGADPEATTSKGESILTVLREDLAIIKNHYDAKRSEAVESVIELLESLDKKE